ncbi:MFS transporter [Natronomonas sp. F2-12]|uniref:MFS transporter n=2 Tax=Natronomonas aquatica TaxID=2841590 RepID=A0A9R1CUZ3_9EURY|nr:MFS transporter [Natronomonas aquatica]
MTSLFESGRKEVTALRRKGRGKILVVVAFPWALLLGSRMALPVLLPYIQTEFDLSLSIVGLLVTLLWLGGAIGQLPGGILADRYQEGSILTLSVGLVALALIVVVLAPNTASLFLTVTLWGFATSLYPIARITILSETYPDRLGSALGLTMATGDLGQTLVPPIAGTLAAVFVWQAGIGFIVPLLVIGGIGTWIVVPRSVQTASSNETSSLNTARYVIEEMRRPIMVFVSFILVLFFFFWQAFTSFFPTYLVVEKGISTTMASLLFGAFFAAGAIVKPVAGMAYDRIGMRWALISVLLGPVAGLLLLPIVERLELIVIVTLAISTMLGNGAVTQSFVAEQFPAEIQGTGLGAVRTIAAVVGSTGPVLFGIVADRGFFDEGYVALAVLLLIVILLAYRMPNPDRG